jgi:hypothetical protein
LNNAGNPSTIPFSSQSRIPNVRDFWSYSHGVTA